MCVVSPSYGILTGVIAGLRDVWRRGGGSALACVTKGETLDYTGEGLNFEMHKVRLHSRCDLV